MKKQITSNILMIRPLHFTYNEETAANNFFQKEIENIPLEKAQPKALEEFEMFVEKLRSKGIHVFESEDQKEPFTPDSIFPNNWVTFHQNGTVVLYPMFAVSRRGERRADILDTLEEHFVINEIYDLTGYEESKKYLEGTGSLVLDRPNGIVYSAISERTDKLVLEKFCEKFDCKAITFTANQQVNGQRLPIYHTNVLMCLAEEFVVICVNAIDNNGERTEVLGSLEKTGKEIIGISEKQMNSFAGNLLQVHNNSGEKFLVMSTGAYRSLDTSQVNLIEKYCQIIHSPLDMIEACGGGSARCMMAEIFLPEKTGS